MTAATNGVEIATQFLELLFEVDDFISIRPVETWTDEAGQKHSKVDFDGVWTFQRVEKSQQDILRRILSRAEAMRTNVYFGVCPRFGNKQYEKAWQIRTARVLWADIDHVEVAAAQQRITEAGLPRPSLIVSSGNGAHVYWRLNAPYLIDDVGDPPPTMTEWIKVDGKSKPIEFFKDHRGDRIYLHDRKTGRAIANAAPKLSPKAQQLQDIVSGIASKIGGDHTHDLARLLRVAGTLNRKDQKNGKEPKPCTLVENNGQRYSLDVFAACAEVSPDRERRLKIASVPLPSRKRMTGNRQDKLSQLIWNCGNATAGERSEADYQLCCWAIEHGLAADEIWLQVVSVGKFAERGRDYFDRTWNKAADKARLAIVEKTERAAGGTSGSTRRTAADPENMTGDGGPVEILLHTREYEINCAVIDALRAEDSLYQRAGQLVTVLHGSEPEAVVQRPDDAPRIASLALATVRETISKNVQFYIEVKTEDGIETVYKHVPDCCANAVHARGQWRGIRHLRGIVNHPVLRPDGSILAQPGYDSQTGLLLHWPGESLRMPEQPSQAEAIAAVARLLLIVEDFPFEKPEHRAAWLAYLLTPLARFAFPQAITSPLFLIDASVRGSGKTKLADAVGMIVCGFDLPRMVLPRDDDELRKHMLAIALAGDELVLIDNVTGELGGQTLDAMLTGTRWKGRILKESRDAEVSLNTTFAATSNNATITGDLCRRTIHIRLLSLLERPGERDDFRIPNLLGHIRQHRAALLVDALTILRAYCLAGRPDLRLPAMGSFEEWSLVRQAVVWCGLPDPWDTRIELAKRADTGVHVLADLLRGWRMIDADDKGLTVAELLQRLESSPGFYTVLRGAISELCNNKPGVLPTPRQLGKRLGSVRDRIVNHERLISFDNGHGVMVWRVDTITTPNPGVPGQSGFSTLTSREGGPLREFLNGHSAPEPSPRNPETPGKPGCNGVGLLPDYVTTEATADPSWLAKDWN